VSATRKKKVFLGKKKSRKGTAEPGKTAIYRKGEGSRIMTRVLGEELKIMV